MAASKLNLAIDQGATFRQRITWKTGTPLAPVDLTGFTARMQMRSEVTSPDILVSLTTENGGITLGGATGTIDLLLTATQTAAFAWDAAVYDLEMVSAGGEVTRLIRGSVAVSPEVTR